MKRAILVHQWMAGAEGDWRPWLRQELEKRGFEVIVPEMPDIDTPVIDAWVEKLREVTGTADTDTYLVGHSIGCQTILRYLETIDTPVGGAIFVAGWFDLENLEDEETARIAAPWINTPIDIEKIREVLPKSSLLISDNDPFGCFETNKARFSEIVTKIIVVPGAAHFSSEDGFTELPAILEKFDFFTHSESLAEALKNEGFTHVYEWTDQPGKTYPPHSHKGKVSFYITYGSVTFSGGFEKEFVVGDRFDVPVGVEHSAVIGADGCGWVIGEEVEGDS